jgi:hypothetical protein
VFGWFGCMCLVGWGVCVFGWLGDSSIGFGGGTHALLALHALHALPLRKHSYCFRTSTRSHSYDSYCFRTSTRSHSYGPYCVPS